MRRLIKDSIVVARSVQVHSRYNANKRIAEKKKGRHSGLGKRKGCQNARCNKKTQHINHIRALRKCVKRYQKLDKITSNEKKKLMLKIKGNEFKSKKALTEEIIQRRNRAREEKAAQELKEKYAAKKKEKTEKKNSVHAQRLQEKIADLRKKAIST